MIHSHSIQTTPRHIRQHLDAINDMATTVETLDFPIVSETDAKPKVEGDFITYFVGYKPDIQFYLETANARCDFEDAIQEAFPRATEINIYGTLRLGGRPDDFFVIKDCGYKYVVPEYFYKPMTKANLSLYKQVFVTASLKRVTMNKNEFFL